MWSNQHRLEIVRQYNIGNLPRTTTREEWREYYRKIRPLEYARVSYDEKRWFAKKSICPRCSAEITNRQYWGDNRRGSAHFKGTCKPDLFFPVKVPRQSWKSNPSYPMPTGGWTPTISNLDEFYAYWNIGNVGGTVKPKRKQLAA